MKKNNNNNLLLILAGAAVLYWLSQKGQTAVTTAPANITSTATGATVPVTAPVGGGQSGIAVGEIYGGNVGNGFIDTSPSGVRGGTNSIQSFVQWINSIPLGNNPNDPRYKPAVIDVKSFQQ